MKIHTYPPSRLVRAENGEVGAYDAAAFCPLALLSQGALSSLPCSPTLPSTYCVRQPGPVPAKYTMQSSADKAAQVHMSARR